MAEIFLNLPVDSQNLAEELAGELGYAALVSFVVGIDAHVADSMFTDMLKRAVVNLGADG